MAVQRIEDDPAAAASVASGGRLVRHSVVMGLDLMIGEAMGPWIAEASLHITDPTDRIVGQFLVNENTASGTFVARPFVTDVCVVLAVAGRRLGTALLAASARRLA